jgi:hypothetical protein
MLAWLIASLFGAGPPAEPAPIVVDDPSTLFVSPLSIETLDEPRWIVHRLRSREKLTRVAARYAVTVAELVKWNDIDPNKTLRKKTLKVLARRVPPPAIRIIYTVQPGETWDDVATKLHVSRRGLKTRHPRVKTLVAGTKLLEWVDPIEGPAFEPDAPDIVDDAPITVGGLSVGRPNRGRLEHGVHLPDSPLWALGKPRVSWGSTHTITVMRTAFTTLRNDIGYRGDIVMGALSMKHGGRFRPHKSHQSGRDIDIRLPLRPGLVDVRHPTADDIDWYATWAIVDAFVRTGEVEAVFLEMGRQERLYTAARILGVTRERLHELVRWPNWSGADPIVRHSDGHDTHIHVRIRCGADEPRCKTGD